MPKRRKTNVQPHHRQFATTLARKRADAIAHSEKFAGTEDEEYVASVLPKLAQKMLDASIIENQRETGKAEEARRPPRCSRTRSACR